MLNTIILQGRLTKDCELRYTKNDKAVTSFTIAVDRDGRDAGAIFVNCVAWENKATFIDQYFKKGDMILIQGKLDSRNYEDKNGNKRTAWEVIIGNVNFCGSKKEQGEYNYNEKPRFVEYEGQEDDGELPF